VSHCSLFRFCYLSICSLIDTVDAIAAVYSPPLSASKGNTRRGTRLDVEESKGNEKGKSESTSPAMSVWKCQQRRREHRGYQRGRVTKRAGRVSLQEQPGELADTTCCSRILYQRRTVKWPGAADRQHRAQRLLFVAEQMSINCREMVNEVNEMSEEWDRFSGSWNWWSISGCYRMGISVRI
jgi:hypothetical protein